MQETDRLSSQHPTAETAVPPRDPAARKAGVLLMLTALATVVAVAGRVTAGADQPTLAESLVAISESRGLYGIGGAGRLVSGITLIAGASFLLRTWIIRDRFGTPLVPFLFVVSGILTAISGACAVVLATSTPAAANAAALGTIDPSIETTALIRWVAGKIGFAAAGVALIVAARYQWMVGGNLRRISPVTATLGIAMQFIWIDSATAAHPVIGTLFFIWLVVIGAMLLTGRVERHFRDMLESGSVRDTRSST